MKKVGTFTNDPSHLSRKPVFSPSGFRKHFIAACFIVQLISVFFGSAEVGAGFASRFSLTLGEEYNDNIFFEEKKEHDFITWINPTLSLLYAPIGQTQPIFTADLTVAGQIFAQHSEESNFGDNIILNTGYTYFHSPRLTLYTTDSLRRRSATRSGEFGGSEPPPPTSLPPPGSVGGLPASQRLGDFIGNGEELSNYFALRGAFTYNRNINFVGDYGFGYTAFVDRGGNEISHRAGVRGVYKWNVEHNLHLGYSVEVINSRDGDTSVIHNLDAGDDYFSAFRILLDPTLTLTASTGVAINVGGKGPKVVNRTNVALTKLWERASLSLGVYKGLTPSFGVSGVSDTTSFFTGLKVRLTERLTGFGKVEYSMYDTDDVNFNTFTASTGLSYGFTSWLSGNLKYTHRRRDAGAGAATTDLLTSSKINGSTVFLALIATFDIWPNLGFAR
jgi:hypothetical protein